TLYQEKQSNTINNRIIHGDNLTVLKSLLPEFEGKVNCIYIDPPYNTGNEGWVYNDNVNDPRIIKWLGDVVGKEGEDLSRHDKWLCMMYPRLKLLHRLLADDGVIFISIDENEISHLRLIMDEIFGEQNFVEQIVWNKRVPKNDKYIGNIHEYIVLYTRSQTFEYKFIQKKEGIDEVYEFLNGLKNKKVDISEAEKLIKAFYKKNSYDRGITLYNSLDENYKLWGKINVSWPNGQTEGPRYDVFHPITKKPCKVPDRGWRWKKSTFDELLDYDNVKELPDGSFICGSIWFAKDENTQPSSIKYLDEVSDFLLRSIISTKSEGSVYLKDIISENFDYPKPVSLIETLLFSFSNKNALILDSFAGSGTTAHAVLKLNAQDGGNRRFILCEMMDYAESITAERVRRVMEGYGEGNKKVEGLGGSFDFYELGDALFSESGLLNESVGIERIRQYIAYSESIPLDNQLPIENSISASALGINQQTLWLFHYNKDAITSLDLNFLGTLNLQNVSRPSQFVVYADKCVLDDKFMQKHGITFKRIPRDIMRF
ncbi:site-specific DNA-methyltransferase, partial [Acinetobacter pittii]|uniref:site-specific DNA-methyltransferase n=1 Tax=Acinetobacter pittii TaxID=48296 RepID=UPI00207C50A3